MKRNKHITVLTMAATLLSAFQSSGLMPVMAQTVPADVIVDFEDKATGAALPVFSLEGSGAAAAVVAPSPGGRAGKAARLTTSAGAPASGLNIRVANLPDGHVLSDYDYLAFDYYRTEDDGQAGTTYVAMNGREVWDEPYSDHFGDHGRWYRRVVPLEGFEGDERTRITALRIAILGGGKDYYIDNVRLVRDVDYGRHRSNGR